jgi:alkaline phosphatase
MRGIGTFVRAAAVVALAATPAAAQLPGLGSVIFVHPDGASAGTWTAARALHVGPDGELEWDRLPHVAVYKGHMLDRLTATSNGGATVHAYGRKVAYTAYGLTAGGSEGREILDGGGRTLGVARQALEAGLDVGLVQSGISTEPGTGCFLASVASRKMHEAIAAQLVESGAAVLLGGGETHFLPEGAMGAHGPGMRTDGRDLVAEARARGYAVVRTREELMSLPSGTTRVLGLFAHKATFNDRTEEELRERGLEPFDPDAPTIGEMTEVALRVLRDRGRRFLLVIEEEGTDNFGNRNNASGVMEAARRADEAIGVCRADVRAHPDTLLVTAADSDGGGMRMLALPMDPYAEVTDVLPPEDPNGAPLDGVGGTGTAPFVSAPDARGERWPFAIAWASYFDVSGGVVVRAEGLNSHLVRGTMDNTEVAELMRLTLMGRRAAD